MPNIVPEPFGSMYEPTRLRPWKNSRDSLPNKPFIQKQQRKTWQVEHWDWPDWAPIVSRYLGEITLMDYHIGAGTVSSGQFRDGRQHLGYLHK